jgi:hypothetical protein
MYGSIHFKGCHITVVELELYHSDVTTLSANVMESGSLNLPEPSGPHRPVMGLLYLYLGIPKQHTFCCKSDMFIFFVSHC